MIDNNNDKDKQIEIEIDNLDALEEGMSVTLTQSVEKKKNLSFRVRETLHNDYKLLADGYKNIFEKTVPLGDLGDQLVEQLNKTLSAFLAKHVVDKMMRGWVSSLHRDGYRIDIVDLTITNVNNNDSGVFFNMRHDIELLIYRSMKALHVPLEVQNNVLFEAWPIIDTHINTSRKNALFSIASGSNRDLKIWSNEAPIRIEQDPVGGFKSGGFKINNTFKEFSSHR